MSIVRAPRRGKFEIIPAETLEDQAISYKALGILGRLLRLPDWGAMSSLDLARGKGREGRDAVRSGLRELEEAGYIRREKYRNVQGQWNHRMVVFDTKFMEPGPGNPAPDFQALNTEDAIKNTGDIEALYAGLRKLTGGDLTAVQDLLEGYSESVIREAALGLGLPPKKVHAAAKAGRKRR